MATVGELLSSFQVGEEATVSLTIRAHDEGGCQVHTLSRLPRLLLLVDGGGGDSKSHIVGEHQLG